MLKKAALHKTVPAEILGVFIYCDFLIKMAVNCAFVSIGRFTAFSLKKWH
jgi:hypothetical protein